MKPVLPAAADPPAAEEDLSRLLKDLQTTNPKKEKEEKKDDKALQGQTQTLQTLGQLRDPDLSAKCRALGVKIDGLSEEAKLQALAKKLSELSN